MLIKRAQEVADSNSAGKLMEFVNENGGVYVNFCGAWVCKILYEKTNE